MTPREEFEQWIEDNVELPKNLDEEGLLKGLIIDGLFVPTRGLFGIKNMKWGAKHHDHPAPTIGRSSS